MTPLQLSKSPEEIVRNYFFQHGFVSLEDVQKDFALIIKRERVALTDFVERLYILFEIAIPSRDDVGAHITHLEFTLIMFKTGYDAMHKALQLARASDPAIAAAIDKALE